MDFYTFLLDYVDPGLLIFLLLFMIAFLLTLYSIQLVNNKLRVMHEELLRIAEDNRLLNDSLHILQGQLQQKQQTKTP